MADRHQGGAEDDGASLAKHAVGKQPTEERRQINEAGIETVDLRSERLQIEWAEHGFQCATEDSKPENVTGVLWFEQILDHVEHQQCAHPVKGETLPHLSREKVTERARMAEEFASGRRSCRHAGPETNIKAGLFRLIRGRYACRHTFRQRTTIKCEDCR